MLLRATHGESKGISEGVGKVLLRGVSGSITLVRYLVDSRLNFLALTSFRNFEPCTILCCNEGTKIR